MFLRSMWCGLMRCDWIVLDMTGSFERYMCCTLLFSFDFLAAAAVKAFEAGG